MMRSFSHQTFEHFYDDDFGALFRGAEFLDCIFKGCALSTVRTPVLRTRVQDICLKNCAQSGCSIYSAVCEDILVDGFATSGQPFQTWAAAFRHVEFRGNIGDLMLSNVLLAGLGLPSEQGAFDRANSAFYQDVDWALDIRRAEFEDLEIRGVPARLIRRDPETEVIITRERALEGTWTDLKFKSDVTPICIQLFLDRGDADYVFVAAKRNSCFRDRLADVRLLRKAGIAEPD
jgi:hypothetical protein